MEKYASRDDLDDFALTHTRVERAEYCTFSGGCPECEQIHTANLRVIHEVTA